MYIGPSNMWIDRVNCENIYHADDRTWAILLNNIVTFYDMTFMDDFTSNVSEKIMMCCISFLLACLSYKHIDINCTMNNIPG